MIFRDHELTISCQIQEVLYTPIHNWVQEGIFSKWDPVTEEKSVRFTLKVQVADSIWDVAYLMKMTKSLTRGALETYTDSTSITQESFEYYRFREIQQPMAKMANQPGLEIALEVIMLLDTKQVIKITGGCYNEISLETLLLSTEMEMLATPDRGRYTITKYKNLPLSYESLLVSSRAWEGPCLNLCGNSSWMEVPWPMMQAKGGKILSMSTFNLVPLNYSCSYNQSRSDKGRSILYEKPIIAFTGSFEECAAILRDTTKMATLRKSIAKEEQRKLTFRQDDGYDWERDYFDAMTDGQLGSYDDFDGSSDDVDTWSRG